MGIVLGEVLDSDSRFSLGFYEMSDGGFCFLFMFCVFVCSDYIFFLLGSLLFVV